jgi:hypothetical protein
VDEVPKPLQVTLTISAGRIKSILIYEDFYIKKSESFGSVEVLDKITQ